ncbi:hypothetical protein [Patulibacter minatonensis]|uniref:hypothetical protein n=1 Tax=Patulibacter minatonensis TaxID=298163 RepID=UPI00047BE1AA|nr:hypothetical protein [Patulibacter minatonensis]
MSSDDRFRRPEDPARPSGTGDARSDGLDPFGRPVREGSLWPADPVDRRDPRDGPDRTRRDRSDTDPSRPVAPPPSGAPLTAASRTPGPWPPPGGTAPGTSAPRRRRRAWAAVAACVVLGAGCATYAVVQLGGSSDDDAGPVAANPAPAQPTATTPTATAPSVPPTPTLPTPAPTGTAPAVDPRSPGSVPGSRRAMERLRRAVRDDERVAEIDLDDDELTAQLVRPSGTPAGELTISRRGRVTREGRSTLDGPTPGLRAADLDVAGPGRIIASALRGLGPDVPGRVDFAAADRTDDGRGPLRWRVFLDDTADVDGVWRGDGHGRHVVRSRDDAPAPPPGGRGPVSAPVALSSRSLLRGENMSRALDAVRSAMGGDYRVMTLYVTPERLSVLAQRGSRLRSYDVDPTFLAERGEAYPGYGEGLASARFRGTGPERAVRTLRDRSDPVATTPIRSALLNVASGTRPAGWTLTFGTSPAAAGPTLSATLDGRRVGPLGVDLGG